MKKLLIMFIAFVGCNKQVLLKKSEVVSIVVSVNQVNTDNQVAIIFQNVDTFIITDQHRIKKILNTINRSRKELIKFYPNYSIRICYKNDVQLVFIKDKYCKINGISYIMPDNIDSDLK